MTSGGDRRWSPPVTMSLTDRLTEPREQFLERRPRRFVGSLQDDARGLPTSLHLLDRQVLRLAVGGDDDRNI